MSLFVSYFSLEPDFEKAIVPQGFGFSTDKAPDLGAVFTFVWVGLLVLCVAAGAFRLAYAGWLRMQLSGPAEQAIRASDAAIKSVGLGLLGILGMFVFIYTFNRDLLRVDVGLSDLKTEAILSSPSSPQVVTTVPTQTSGQSASCTTSANIISAVQSQSGLCGSASCSSLTGCTYQPYLSTIRAEAGRLGISPELAVTIMCKESKGRPSAQNRNPNGTYDCGLMQVNQTAPCDASILDPATNIRLGLERLKQYSNVRIYEGVPVVGSIAASYNSGPAYNNPSVDCTNATGFPTIPKWACPINPGDGQFNMCAVKNYACEVSACVDQLKGRDL